MTLVKHNHPFIFYISYGQRSGTIDFRVFPSPETEFADLSLLLNCHDFKFADNVKWWLVTAYFMYLTSEFPYMVKFDFQRDHFYVL